MKKLLLPLLLPSCAVFAAQPHDVPELFPDSRRPMPAEVDPVDWFPRASFEQLRRIRRNSSQHYADIQIMAQRFMRDPGDGEAFCALSADSDAVNELLQQLIANTQRADRKKLETLLKFRTIYQVRGIANTYLQQLKQTPRPEFVLRLRDMLQQKTETEDILHSLYDILENDDTLNHAELDMICRGLMVWCEISSTHRTAGAAARLYLRDFRRGKPVVLTPQMEADMCLRYPHLRRFVMAERAINQCVPKYLANRTDWEENALATLLWQNTSHAVQLARHLGLAGYALLEHTPENLQHYMRFCGISHYRAMGQEVPECCTLALNARSLSPHDLKTFDKELNNLAPELRPLAPRCLLALGARDRKVWAPIKRASAAGLSPACPDASAVQLPMWQDNLLELRQGDTLAAAFDKELAEFGKLADNVKKHRGTGYILARALSECEQVRPRKLDLVTPVYYRIAIRFDEDGVALSYVPDKDDFDITYHGPVDPLLQTALHNMPQHLHRLTLLLALLEKQGKIRELEAACNKLALQLNRCELWPLIICQRELRGFSTRALLTLFSYYEGEDDALFDYGEAMGLRHEMAVARLGNEDELGENLLRAAVISRALPATDEQRKQAVADFMQLAKEGAEEQDNRLTGGILHHLLKHGESSVVLAWQDCPPRFWRGRYASNGLRLIRATLQSGQRQRALSILSAMQADAATGTTPACRLAQALLSTDPAEKTRLQQDALLLAMLYRHIDHSVYEDYLAILADEGDPQNDIMRTELHFSCGRSAGLSPELGFAYARNGRWGDAAFVFEYMLTQGLTTTTPYGNIPNHADMYFYRAYADICHSKADKNPVPARQALASLAGTPAEAIAKELMALPADRDSSQKPRTTPIPPPPAEQDLLAALPPRSWKLKNGRTVEGALISLVRGISIRLRLKDGTARTFPMGEIAGNEMPYFNRWITANKLTTWDFQPSEISPRYRRKLTGRPIYALPDFAHPGGFYMALVEENGNISTLRTWGLRGEQKMKAETFCRQPKNLFAPELKLATTPDEALKMSREQHLPILLLCCIPVNGVNALTQYLMLHPEAAQVWAKQCILLPVMPPTDGARPIRYAEATRAEMLKLEQAIRPATTEDNAITTWVLHASQQKAGNLYCALLSREHATAYQHKADFTLPAEQQLRNGIPLTPPKKGKHR